MGYEDNTGLKVHNHYGARDTGGAVGVEHSKDSTHAIRVDLTGQSINDAFGGFLPPVSVPKGARFLRATLRVDQVFVVTGTNAVLEVGAKASEATNGVTITEAQLEALGSYDLSSALAGTWATNAATGTAAAALVSMVIGGTDTPAVAATTGKGSLILEFVNVTKI